MRLSILFVHLSPKILQPMTLSKTNISQMFDSRLPVCNMQLLFLCCISHTGKYTFHTSGNHIANAATHFLQLEKPYCSSCNILSIHIETFLQRCKRLSIHIETLLQQLQHTFYTHRNLAAALQETFYTYRNCPAALQPVIFKINEPYKPFKTSKL